MAQKVSWCKELMKAIFKHDSAGIAKVYAMKDANIDRVVEHDDGFHYLFGDFSGVYHEAYDEEIQAYVSGAYSTPIQAGDSALMIALKTEGQWACLHRFASNLLQTLTALRPIFCRRFRGV
jgi:hypothetical protein